MLGRKLTVRFYIKSSDSRLSAFGEVYRPAECPLLGKGVDINQLAPGAASKVALVAIGLLTYSAHKFAGSVRPQQGSPAISVAGSAKLPATGDLALAAAVPDVFADDAQHDQPRATHFERIPMQCLIVQRAFPEQREHREKVLICQCDSGGSTDPRAGSFSKPNWDWSARGVTDLPIGVSFEILTGIDSIEN